MSGSDDKTIKVWKILEQKEGMYIHRAHRPSSSLAVSEDGRFLVSGSYEELKVWNIEKRSEEYTEALHTGTVSSVAVSVD